MKKLLLSSIIVAVCSLQGIISAQISVSPVARLVSAKSGTTSFTVSSTVGWSVSDDASWLTATKTSGTNISVGYSANASTSSRTASITVSGTGGLTETVTVKQEGATVFLAVSPDSRSLDPESGSTVFYVTSNVGWSVSDDASWLTATKTNGSTISVSYSANNSTIDRTANITVTGTGGITETVRLYQEDGYISFNAPPQNISAEAGSVSIQLSIKISEWTVTDDASWVIVTKSAGSDLIDVSWDANPSTSPRDVNITVTGTGEITTSGVLRLTQEGKVPYLDVSPDNLKVSSEAGIITYNVSTNVGWSVTNSEDWCRATKTDASTISVSYEANPGKWPRMASITVTATGGLSENVDLTQFYKATIDVSPNNINVDANSGTAFFEVTSSHMWAPFIDADWLSVSNSVDGISVIYEANDTPNPRTAVIIAHTAENSDTVTLTQAGITLDVSPNSRSVSLESGSVDFSVTTTGLHGWDLSDDADWLIAIGAVDNMILAIYEANMSVNSRTANILVEGSGGISETVTVTQFGSGPYLDISSNSLSLSDHASESYLDVSTNVEWNVSDDADWLTTYKLSEDEIRVTWSDNPTADIRTALITVDAEGGLTEIITATQEGKSISLYLDDDHIDVGAEAGSTNMNLDTNHNAWSVTDNASWLSTTKVSNSRIGVSYEANPSTGSRTALITVDATGGVIKTATVTQAGAAASLDVSPNSQVVVSAAGTASLNVNSTVGWSVSDDADWLTATKANGSTIQVIFDANPSTSQRTASITANGTGGISETVTLTQESATASLDVSPNSESVGSESGTTSFSVNSNVGWSVSDDAAWLTATKIDANTISVSFETNASTESRTASISADGTGGASETVTVIQLSEGITFEVSPNSKNVSAASGTTNFIVSSNVEWSVSDDADWMTATKKDETTIDVSYDANTSIDARTASITASGTGGATKTLQITQDGTAAYLDISPNTQDVGAASGTLSYTVSSNVEWFVSENEPWISASKTDESTITVSYEANTSTSPRTAYFGAFGPGALSEVVELTQDGAAVIFNVSPNSESVGYESGTMSFSVNSNIDWSVSDDADWLTATKTDENTISVSFEANASTESRTANISAEGSGGVSETVTLIQLTEGVTFEVSPVSENVSAGSGTTSFSVNANIDWSVSDDADWLTATKTDETTITVSYEGHTSTDARTANITVIGTGGASKTLTVTQEGAAAYLDLSSYSLSLGSRADSVLFTVFSNIDWTANEDSEWLSIARVNDTTVIVYYDENTSVDMRSADLTLSAEGVESQIVTLVQEGTVISSIIDLFDQNQITVYPNPTSNKIYIMSASDINSDVLISLYDGSGKLLHMDNLAKISSNEPIQIDISAYNPGVYILRLYNSESLTIRKIIKQE